MSPLELSLGPTGQCTFPGAMQYRPRDVTYVRADFDAEPYALRAFPNQVHHRQSCASVTGLLCVPLRAFVESSSFCRCLGGQILVLLVAILVSVAVSPVCFAVLMRLVVWL